MVSRGFSALSAVKDEKDIQFIIRNPYSGTVEDMLNQRFYINKENIMPFETNKYENINDYLSKYYDKIKKNSSKMRKNYKKYINKLNVIFEKNIAFFDFVSSGTTQMCLNKILNTELVGFYFIRILDDYADKQNLIIDSFQKEGYSYELNTNLYNKDVE